MKTLMKILGFALLAVVILVAAAAIAVPMLVDGEDVKSALADQVKRQTGRELRIPGDVQISVFPWLGAKLGAVQFGNAQGFSAPVFASTERVDVRVKLMPLLDRRVEMDTVTVHGLVLNLEKNAQGKSNWEDLGAGRSAATSGTPGGQDAGGLPIEALAIGGLDVRDANLSYRDAKASQAFELRNLSLTTGAVELGQPVDVQLGFDLSTQSPPLSGRVTASARVDADPGGASASVADMELSADLKGDTLPGGAATASVRANADFDGAAQSLSIRDLVARVLDLTATGALNVTGLDGTPQLAGQLEVQQFNPRAVLKALGGDDVKTADAAVLARASLSSTLSGTPSSLSLKPLSLKLDDSTLIGEASVSNFSAPAIRFTLSLDTIDLDRYLPPSPEGAAASPGAASSQAVQLPTQTLRALNVDGTLKASSVRVSNLSINDLSAKLEARKGVIKLSPMSARLYDGAYAGNVVLDASGDTPKLEVNETLSTVQIGPLLEDLQGKAPISGTANLAARLTARGVAKDAIVRTLNGDVSFQFLNGALNGVNIAKMIRDAKATLSGGAVASTGKEPLKTDFAEISGTAKITDGTLSNQDLAAKTPLLRLAGKGTAVLPTQALDYRATATVVATAEGQGGKDLTELGGVPIPVHITGTFTEPSYGLDVQALGEALAKSKAKELVEAQKAKVTEKVEETVKKKLGDSLGDKAGKLLGGDKKGGGLLDNLLKN